MICMLPWCNKPATEGEAVCPDCDWQAEEYVRGQVSALLDETGRGRP